jgi:hypothetical protein
LTIISALQHIAIFNKENKNIDFIGRLALPLFPLVGILLVYQSGFFVFTAFSILFCLIHLFFNNTHGSGFTPILSRAQVLLLPFLSGIFFSLILLPELALHTAQRTIDVKSALNGWPLPLIAPEHILSIPSSKEFPLSFGNPVSYIITFGLVIFTFLFSYTLSKKKDTELASRLLIFVTFFCSSIAAYILAYLIKGEIYQVWKFAAFVVLPMSFVLYASFALLCQQSTFFGEFFRKSLMPLFILGGVFVVAINPSNRNLESISHKIEQFKVVKHNLLNSDIKNIILSNMTYGDTMMAFNILSNDFKIYPTIQTYIYPVDDSLIQQLNPATTRVLVSAECFTDNQDQTNSHKYDIILINEMLNNHAHPFGISSYHCQSLKVDLSGGFSNIEDWGVWTVGNKSSMTINLPPALIGMELRLTFNVQPFSSQDVSVEISGYSKNWAIKQPTKLSFILPPNITNQKQLLLNFTIDHPISPSSIDSKSTDTRLLGLGFVSLDISNTHQ